MPKKASKTANKKVKKVMGEYKEGSLKLGQRPKSEKPENRQSL